MFKKLIVLVMVTLFCLNGTAFASDEYTENEQKLLDMILHNKSGEARQIINKTLETEPTPNLYFLLGKSYEVEGNNKETINAYKEAVRVKPDFGKAYNNMGIAYYELKDYQNALETFESAVQFMPDASSYFNRGNANYKLKKYTKALVDYNEAIKLDPNENDYYLNRGNVYADLKQYNKAISNYKTILKKDENNTNALYNLGVAYRKKHNDKKALPCFEKVAELDNEKIGTFYHLGEIYAKEKQFDKAQNSYERLCELDGGFYYYHYLLGTTLLKKGLTDEALYEFDSATNLNRYSELPYFKRANILFQRKEFSNAFSEYIKGIILWLGNIVIKNNFS